MTYRCVEERLDEMWERARREAGGQLPDDTGEAHMNPSAQCPDHPEAGCIFRPGSGWLHDVIASPDLRAAESTDYLGTRRIDFPASTWVRTLARAGYIRVPKLDP